MKVVTYSYQKDKNKVLTPHFKVGEFRSYNNNLNKLTTDTILIADELPVMLEKLYVYLDKKYGLKKIIITSGYRSNDFEKYLSGNVIGYHVKGMAADIMCYKKDGSLISSKNVCLAAEDIGFKGIGYMTRATHVDVRDNKSYFDETNNRTSISSWYSYFGINNSDDSTKLTYKIGDIVNFNKIYVSSTSNEALNPKITSGKITKIYQGTNNPYLIDNNIGFINDNCIINSKITKIVSNCTSLNLRTSSSYGNNIKYIVKKGTKVTYLGIENGWAKISYNNIILYCGIKYLK